VNKRNLRPTAAYFAAVGLIIALIAAPRATAQADTDGTKVNRGKRTYAENCSHCHGPNMLNSGTITPDLRRFPDDKQRFSTTVKNGKNNKMPPWGDILDDDKIEALWAFVSSQRKP
jgi:mono/diheme cytochrome c family protein